MLRRPQGRHTPPGRRPATPLSRHRTRTPTSLVPWLARRPRLRHWTSQAKTLLPPEDGAVIDSHLTALRTIGVPRADSHVISTSSRATGWSIAPATSRSSTSSTRTPTCPPATSCACDSGSGHLAQTCTTPSSTDTGAASPTPKTNWSGTSARSTHSRRWREDAGLETLR